jgi:hypothetical protein
MRAEFTQFARGKWEERSRALQAMRQEQAADLDWTPPHLANPTLLVAQRLGVPGLMPLPLSGAQDLQRAVGMVWVEQAKRTQARKEKGRLDRPSVMPNRAHHSRNQNDQQNPINPNSQNNQHIRTGPKHLAPRKQDPRFNQHKAPYQQTLVRKPGEVPLQQSFSYAQASSSSQPPRQPNPLVASRVPRNEWAPHLTDLNPSAAEYRGGDQGGSKDTTAVDYGNQDGQYISVGQPDSEVGGSWPAPLNANAWGPGAVTGPGLSWDSAPGAALSWNAQAGVAGSQAPWGADSRQAQAPWDASGQQAHNPWDYQTYVSVASDYVGQQEDPEDYQDFNPQQNATFNPLMGDVPQPLHTFFNDY